MCAELNKQKIKKITYMTYMGKTNRSVIKFCTRVPGYYNYINFTYTNTTTTTIIFNVCSITDE